MQRPRDKKSDSTAKSTNVHPTASLASQFSDVTSLTDTLTQSQTRLMNIQTQHGNAAARRSLSGMVRGRLAGTSYVNRFEGPEHRDLGVAGSGGAATDLNVGTDAVPEYLTYGEMVAVAGDFFESLDQMRDLARSQNGRDQIRWARWKDLNPTGGGAEPAVDQTTVKDVVMNNYYRLAANNIAHFSAGGTANNQYEVYHRQACQKAFESGATGDAAKFADARTTEAFGNHFLTDMFSAGHVRTERANIKAWYTTHFPLAIDQFITYMAVHMRAFLTGHHGVLNFFGQIPSQASIEGDVRTLGGAAIRAFSLGDIVSLASHNYDNTNGLNVTSDAGASGAPGPVNWQDFGDNNLSRSSTTRDMAVAAVRTSLIDLDRMRAAGAAARAGAGPTNNPMDTFPVELGNLAPAAIPGRPAVPYAAERLIPRENPTAGNVVMHWEWGSLNPELRTAVDAAVKHDVADALNEKAAALPVATTEQQLKKDALDDLVTHFRAQGILAIEAAVHAPAGGTTPVPAAAGGTP